MTNIDPSQTKNDLSKSSMLTRNNIVSSKTHMTIAAMGIVRGIVAPCIWVLISTLTYSKLSSSTFFAICACLNSVAYILFEATMSIRSQPFVSTVSNGLNGLVVGIVAYMLVFLSFGITIGDIDVLSRVISGSAYLSSLIFVPSSCIIGCRLTIWKQLFCESDYGASTVTYGERVRRMSLLYTVGGASAGAWLSCYALSLDWDQPWQEFPIPLMLGACFGQFIGGCLCFGVNISANVEISRRSHD